MNRLEVNASTKLMTSMTSSISHVRASAVVGQNPPAQPRGLLPTGTGGAAAAAAAATLFAGGGGGFFFAARAARFCAEPGGAASDAALRPAPICAPYRLLTWFAVDAASRAWASEMDEGSARAWRAVASAEDAWENEGPDDVGDCDVVVGDVVRRFLKRDCSSETCSLCAGLCAPADLLIPSDGTVISAAPRREAAAGAGAWSCAGGLRVASP